MVLEVQQIDGGTVTLPANVLSEQQKSKGKSPNRQSSGSRRRSKDRHEHRHHSKEKHNYKKYEKRPSSDPYDQYKESIVNQKSTHV